MLVEAHLAEVDACGVELALRDGAVLLRVQLAGQLGDDARVPIVDDLFIYYYYYYFCMIPK